MPVLMGWGRRTLGCRLVVVTKVVGVVIGVVLGCSFQHTPP